MDAVRVKVESLIDDELAYANLSFPMFRSTHEGYAVIAEEKEEVEEALNIFSKQFETFWMHIRGNRTDESVVSASYLRRYAVSLAIESIQLAAMCQKYCMSIGGEEDAKH